MLERLRTLFPFSGLSDGSADIKRHQFKPALPASRRYFISLLMPWGMLLPSTSPIMPPFSQPKLDTLAVVSTTQTPAPAMVGSVVAEQASAQEITLAERLDALQKQPTISSQIVDLKRSTLTQESTPSAIGGAVAQLTAFTNASVSTQSNTPALSFGLWPVDGSISQYFSAYHSGIDIQGPIGSDVHAVANGTVLFAGNDGSGYGTYIVVDHGNGYQTLYGHLSKLEVAKDDKVSAGQEIGLRGSTGRSTGPHLHFEVIKDGRYQNPVSFLPAVVAEETKPEVKPENKPAEIKVTDKVTEKVTEVVK